MAHYLIFGDSIAYGEGDLKGGWVKLLSEKKSVKNLSIDGATTADYLKNFPAGLNKNSTLIIALGVNDAAKLPLKNYRQNLIQLIELAQKYTTNIVLIGPAPVDQAKVDPVPWAPDLSYKNDLIKKYSEAIKLICRKEKLQFVDLFNNLKSDYINCLDDGLHPNHAGHRMIFNLIQKIL